MKSAAPAGRLLEHFIFVFHFGITSRIVLKDGIREKRHQSE